MAILDDERAVPALMKALLASNSDVRAEAAKALAILDDERAVPALMEALSAPNSGVRAEAAKALGMLGDKRAVPALMEALSASNSGVRVEAAKALGMLGDKRAVSVLILALKTAAHDVCVAAASALGALGDSSATPGLVEALLGKGGQSSRTAAARALGKLANSEAIAALTQARSDYYLKAEVNSILDELGYAKPIASFKFVVDTSTTHFAVNTYSLLRGSIANDGDIDTHGVTLTLSGHVVGTEQKRFAVANVIEPGKSIGWWADIVPDAAGQVPLDWHISFHDDVDSGYQIRTGRLYVEVALPGA